MENEAALWEFLLTWGMFFGLFGGALVASLWARRRRRRGEEGSTDNAEGAEALLSDPGHWGVP